MKLTVEELADLVEGQLLRGPADRMITGVAALDQAGPGDAAFFGNAKYLPLLRSARAGAVFIPRNLPPAATEREDASFEVAWIEVANPSLAFSKLVERFAPPAPTYPPGVAPTAVLGRDIQLGTGVSIQACAVIEDGVQIGDSTVIGAGCFIGQGSVLGARCKLYPRVTVREGTRIGNRVIVHSGAVIGGDGFGFELHEGRHVKIPQLGAVRIDDDVEIGANATIDRARFGFTHIGEGTKIDNLVQIAHNVVIGPHCLIVAQTGISGSTKLGKYVTLAGQVGTVGHVEIGDYTVVAAKSGVSKNTPPKSTLFGIIGEPLEQAKANMAHVRRLPRLIERVKMLEAEVRGMKEEE